MDNKGVKSESSTRKPSGTNEKAGAKPGQTNLFALLIGINTYSGHKNTTGTRGSSSPIPEVRDWPVFPDLYGAVPDAERFQTYLLSTLNIDPSHITLLRNEFATRKNIIDAFQGLANNNDIKKGDSILIFYAGHGGRALPPKRMRNLGGCPKRVELLIPSDFGNNSTDCRRMGIPDYTLAALLDKISKEKGNKITLVFDCCHSASITRGLLTSTPSHDPDSQEITRAGPDLDYPVPDDLDEEIWGGKRAIATVPAALKDTGSSSYVLFSACKSNEFAKERSKEGYFTKALLELLNDPELNEFLCSQIITRLQKVIQGQSPQCEGLHSVTRPFFQGYTSPYAKRFFNITAGKGAEYVLNGGEVHGFCEGDRLTVHESRSKDHQAKPIATVVITKVLNDTSNLRLASGSALSLTDHPKAAALLSETAKQYLKVHVDGKEHALLRRIKELKLCITVDARSDAHIAISVNRSEPANQKLCFEVVDKDLLGKDEELPGKTRRKGTKMLALKPRLVDYTDEDLAHVMKGLSHYYRHLKRTSDSLKGSIDKISVSFFEVQDTGRAHPRVAKVDGAKNLCRNSVIDIDVTANPEAIYGFEITNNTEHGEILFPVLFYFDNTEFTISQSYPHIVSEERTEVSWPKKGESLTIGYGVGIGSNVHPFGFYVGEDYTVEAGFFKLFLFEKPVNLQSIIQEESVFTRSRGMEQKPQGDSSRRWGSITLNVIQRKG